MEKVDLGRLAGNVGVAALLLGGIVVCVVQGYNGYLALQDDTVSAARVKPNATPEYSTPAIDRSSVTEGASLQPISTEAPAVRASTRWRQDRDQQGTTVEPAVWRPQQAVQAPQSVYRAPPRPAFGPPSGIRTGPTVWQGPTSKTPPAYGPRMPVRSGPLPSIAPGFKGKACVTMGFG